MSITNAESYLKTADANLGKLIESQDLRRVKKSNGYFDSLCRSIIGQQVSVASAATIFRRFEELTNLKPQKVLNLTEAEIKQIGLSRQKSGYLRDLAAHFDNNPDVYKHLEELSDEDVIKELTLVKGIGVWTAQMFLIFTLERPDVFAPDDVGLQRAMMKLYGWVNLPTKSELEKVALRWSPYRTTACLYLWNSLDNTP